METNKNNESSNKKRYSNKQKLILSGALTLLIAGVSVGGVILVKDAKLNETNKKLVGIQNKNKTLELQLKTTHDKLTKTIKDKLNELDQKLGKEAKKYNTLKESLKTETNKAIAFKESFNKFKTKTNQTKNDALASFNSFKGQTELDIIELEAKGFLAPAIYKFFSDKDEYKKAFNNFKKKLIKETFENSFIFKLVANGRTFTGITATNLKSKKASLLNQQTGVAKNQGKTLKNYQNEVKTDFLTSVKNIPASETKYNKALEVWKQTDDGVAVTEPNELKVMFQTTPEYNSAWINYLAKIDNLKTSLKTLTTSLKTLTTSLKTTENKLAEALSDKANTADIYTKTELDSKLDTKISQTEKAELSKKLEVVLTTALEDYALKSEITKPALTTLLKAVFAKKDFSQLTKATLITKLAEALSDKANVADIYTKTELDGKLDTKISQTEKAELSKKLKVALNTALEDYALKSEITKSALTTLLNAVFAKKDFSQLTKATLITKLAEALSDKANVADIYTKTELDGKLDTKISQTEKAELSKKLKVALNTALEDYALKSEITKSALTTLLNAVFAKKDFSQLTKATLITKLAEALSDKANTADIYTKTELDGKLDTKISQTEKAELSKKLEAALTIALEDYALKSEITKSALTTLLNAVFAKKDFSQLTKATLISKLAEALSDKANIANIYTKTELDGKLDTKTSQTETKKLETILTTALEEYDMKNAIAKKALRDKADTVDTYTKTELDALIKKLETALTTALEDYAKKGEISKVKKELILLNADGTLKDSLKTKIQDLINTDKLMKQLKKIMVKTDETTTPHTVREVIYEVVEERLMRHSFYSVIVELKRLSNVTEADHLHTTNGDKNLFYKLAPALFTSVKQANTILSDLLSGSTTKPNINALWKVGTSNDWKVGTLNALKAKKDQQYQKVIFIFNKARWGVSNNADAKYTPVPAANEKEDTTPTGK